MIQRIVAFTSLAFVLAFVPQRGAQDPAPRTRLLADEYFAGQLQHTPEFGTRLGIAGTRHDGVTDNSLAALAAWEGREDRWLAAVKQIDPASLAGTPEWVLYAILRERLESSVGQRVCHTELWNVASSANSWQADYTDLALSQPVGTADLRAQALTRAHALPKVIDTETANLRSGLSQGYSSSKTLTKAVITQIDRLLAMPVVDSPFADPAKRGRDPVFRDAYRKVVRGEIYPAMKRYRDYLEKEYLPKARTGLGLNGIRGGAACYAASVRAFATLSVTPDQVYQLGVDQMAQIDARMKAIAQRDFGTSDVPALLKSLTTDPKYTYKTGDEVIAVAKGAVARATAALPRIVLHPPAAKVVVEPYPEFRQQAGAPGQYEPAPDDGSRPARYLINPSNPTRRSRAETEDITFHETIPGHHLQGAVAHEMKSAHPLVRYFYSSGFGEGWALYAEQLADELGLYSTPAARIGMLSGAATRAARCVIDAGIHTKNWTRDQAVEYLTTHTVLAPNVVQGEVDRYISWPGQGPSYMIGKQEIVRLREQAKKQMGAKFDLRAFHDRVLANGTIPLGALQQVVDAWAKK